MSTQSANVNDGDVIYVTWEDNGNSFFGFAAPELSSNVVNGVAVSETIVPDLTEAAGLQPLPGETWKCQVLRKVSAAAKITIVVKPIKAYDLKGWENVYVPPALREVVEAILDDDEACLMAEGPFGCGKTTIMRAIAAAKGYEFEDISGGLIKDMNSMVGRLMPVVSQTNTLTVEYVPSPLVTAILKAKLPENRHKKFMVFIDEFSRIKEEPRDAFLRFMNGSYRFLDLPVSPGKTRTAGGKAQLVFFQMFKDIFADAGSIAEKSVQTQSGGANSTAFGFFTQVFFMLCQLLVSTAKHVVMAMDRLIHASTQVVDMPDMNLTRLEMPDNVKFVGAANRGSEYTLSAEDAAHVDRWVTVKFDYMPEDQELAHCLRKYPNCPEALLRTAIQVVNEIREKANSDELMLSKSVSTRSVEDVARFLQAGISLKTAMVVAVANKFIGNAPIDGSLCPKDDMEAERVANFIHAALKTVAQRASSTRNP